METPITKQIMYWQEITLKKLPGPFLLFYFLRSLEKVFKAQLINYYIQLVYMPPLFSALCSDQNLGNPDLNDV